MTFQEEQEAFQQQIKENIISLTDLIDTLTKHENLTIKEASLYLLTRINAYENKNICVQLADPPFEKYSLSFIDYDRLTKTLSFVVRNGRFKSEKEVKKYGLIKSEIRKALDNKIESTSTIGYKANEKYNHTERETHLQIIAILAEEIAKQAKKYKKPNGIFNNLAIAKLIENRAKEIEIESLKAKSIESYRKRLAEAKKYYTGE